MMLASLASALLEGALPNAFGACYTRLLMPYKLFNRSQVSVTLGKIRLIASSCRSHFCGFGGV
jgi:hypothetical protein